MHGIVGTQPCGHTNRIRARIDAAIVVWIRLAMDDCGRDYIMENGHYAAGVMSVSFGSRCMLGALTVIGIRSE